MEDEPFFQTTTAIVRLPSTSTLHGSRPLDPISKNTSWSVLTTTSDAPTWKQNGYQEKHECRMTRVICNVTLVSEVGLLDGNAELMT